MSLKCRQEPEDRINSGLSGFWHIVNALVLAIRQVDKEYGNCGCELDPLYKRALELL